MYIYVIYLFKYICVYIYVCVYDYMYMCVYICEYIYRAGNKNEKVIRYFLVLTKNCNLLFKLISSDS